MERLEPYTDFEIEQARSHENLYYELKEKQMEKTATITRLEYKSPWTNPTTNQTVHYHNIWFDNGDIGQIGAMAKEPDFLKEGKQLTYTIETNEKGTKIRRIQPPKQGSKFDPVADLKRQTMIARQSSLKIAFDYLVTNNSTGKQVSPQDIMSLADTFTEWVVR